MEIANPIYDAAFKYLMQDDRAARLLVGRIADMQVESLELRPQERATPRDAERPQGAPSAPPLALFRMDFAARVRTAEGHRRTVLIEIQKTNAPTAVERFRAYLGQQLCSPDNVVVQPSGRREAVPIVTIYLLGCDLGVSEEAVLDVCPRVTARRTGAALDADHPFVAGIHHRSHIVQIPRLRGRRRDELERILSIFDQGGEPVARGGAHVLSIDESEYPQEYGFVLRQLQRAAAEEDVRRFMDGEDQLLLDSVSLGMQAESELALARSIRHLHGLGQDAEAIARALSLDPEHVRRVLTGK